MDIDEARPDIGAAGPTFEDLTLDDRLNDLERVEVYGNSHIALQRLVHVKLLADVARTFGFEATRDRLLPVIERRVGDDEFVVRQSLAEQLQGVAHVLVERGGESGYTLLVQRVLPALARLVVDIQPEVRIAAGEALVTVASMLGPVDLGARLLTVVVHLAHNDEAEDMRMTAAVLLNELATSLGPDLCAQFVCSELEHLARDPVFRVRKATALNIDAVCRVVGPTVAAARLLPSFLLLASDDIWGVRKACAESIVCLSKALVPEVRVAKILPLMQSFLSDASRWVRNSAHQHLGPFLATLPSSAITAPVLAPFLAMAPRADVAASGALTSTSPDPELAIFCAFSFPAVALTLGPARWSEIRPLFLVLARHPEKKVRRPVSHSLHELARVVGPDITLTDLYPVFDLFRRDVEDVRRGVIRGLSAFLSGMRPADREACIPVLRETLDSLPPRGWRLRRAVARQVDSLASLFSPVMVFAQVRPLVERLLDDDVAAVRNAAAARLAPLLEAAGKTDIALREEVEASLLARASSADARARVTLVRCLEALAASLPPDDFLGSFLATVKRLGRDPVPAVRRRVAGLIRRATEAAAAAPPGTTTPGDEAAAGGEAAAPAASGAGAAAAVAPPTLPAGAAAAVAAAAAGGDAAARATPPSSPGRASSGAGGGSVRHVVVSSGGAEASSPVKGADAVTVSVDDDDTLAAIENPDTGPARPALSFLASAPGMQETLAALRGDRDPEVRLAAGVELCVGARRGDRPTDPVNQEAAEEDAAAAPADNEAAELSMGDAVAPAGEAEGALAAVVLEPSAEPEAGADASAAVPEAVTGVPPPSPSGTDANSGDADA